MEVDNAGQVVSLPAWHGPARRAAALRSCTCRSTVSPPSSCENDRMGSQSMEAAVASPHASPPPPHGPPSLGSESGAPGMVGPTGGALVGALPYVPYQGGRPSGTLAAVGYGRPPRRRWATQSPPQSRLRRPHGATLARAAPCRRCRLLRRRSDADAMGVLGGGVAATRPLPHMQCDPPSGAAQGSYGDGITRGNRRTRHMAALALPASTMSVIHSPSHFFGELNCHMAPFP